MKAGGSAVELVTRLTQSPTVGRALSAAGGEGAQALADAARSTGTVYAARIPEAVLKMLQNARLLEVRRTLMNGVEGIEYRFAPEAMEYLAKFFKEVGK
jgi:hypothetical protein